MLFDYFGLTKDEREYIITKTAWQPCSLIVYYIHN
jgi:hypothetical protein